MKTINVSFEDGEYQKLDAVKQDMSWHEFIMMLVNVKVKKNGKKESVS